MTPHAEQGKAFEVRGCNQRLCKGFMCWCVEQEIQLLREQVEGLKKYVVHAISCAVKHIEDGKHDFECSCGLSKLLESK